MIIRLKPEQINPGRSYRLTSYYLQTPDVRVVRRVEAISNGNVVVFVNEKEVRIPVEHFALLAVEEVTEDNQSSEAVT